MSKEKHIWIVSVSGGKDSQATLMWMLENYPNDDIRGVMADTKWEHPETMKHIEYLKKVLGVEIEILDTLGFEELAVKKKMFPSRVRRFCTEYLKVRPLNAYFRELKKKNPNSRIVSVNGVRASESQKRKGEGKWKTVYMFDGRPSKKWMTKENSITVFQPIVGWSEADVYDYIQSRGVKMNPLYFCGATRVGCYPCIMSNKIERSMLEQWAIDKVSNLERKVSEIAGVQRYFWHIGKESKTMEEVVRDETPYNQLGLDLGCINHLGKCE